MRISPLFAVAIFLLIDRNAALADMSLASAKNCAPCHSVEKRLLGPSYKEIAQRYANQREAPELLAQKIMKGGTGNWGDVFMPANAQVNPQEAKQLALWILVQK